MKSFFKFMEGQGVEWWFPEVMCRKRDGQRGAPLAGKALGFRFAVLASRGVESFRKIENKLQAHGRGQLGYDFMTRESPARSGRRVLLVDDLDGIHLDELAGWWTGALWAHETSLGNFQALVISPRGLSDADAQRVLRGLAARFDGDPGAAGLDQLHRLPGSKNWKAACIDAGGPFVTRQVLARGSLDAEQAKHQIIELGQAAVPTRRASRAVAAAGGGRDNSSQAFSWTRKELRRGTSADYILEHLSTRWLSHHDPAEWPKRTLENAKFTLGWRSTRYRAGE